MYVMGSVKAVSSLAKKKEKKRNRGKKRARERERERRADQAERR